MAKLGLIEVCILVLKSFATTPAYLDALPQVSPTHIVSGYPIELIVFEFIDHLLRALIQFHPIDVSNAQAAVFKLHIILDPVL